MNYGTRLTISDLIIEKDMVSLLKYKRNAVERQIGKSVYAE